jgi:hypothetical protein
VADSDDHNQEQVVMDAVQDPVVAHTHTPPAMGAAQQFRALRPWINSKSTDRAPDPAPYRLS